VIRGYFSTAGQRRRPFVHALLLFPSAGNGALDVELLVDTGADRTGRDIISLFALVVEQRTERVLLLDSREADALRLP